MKSESKDRIKEGDNDAVSALSKTASQQESEGLKSGKRHTKYTARAADRSGMRRASCKT
jgi:hypothetical protein